MDLITGVHKEGSRYVFKVLILGANVLTFFSSGGRGDFKVHNDPNPLCREVIANPE